MTLYTREAHPAEHIDQPDDFQVKFQHARVYKSRDQIPWPVAVDDLEGSLHRRLGPADTAYVMDANGLVAARVLWAADVRAVRTALEAAAVGEAAGERRPRFRPIVIGASEMHRVFEAAGPRASSDMFRVMPPALVAGRIAARLPRWSPFARGAVASAATAAVLAAVVAGGKAALARLRR